MKIDVIIPAKNPVSVFGEEIVKRSLDSVYAQTYSDWQILLCNYGDRKELEDLIAEYPQEKIKILDGATSFTNALNLGLKNASGDLIARHDLDDFSDDDRFLKQVNYLKKNKKVKLVGTLGYSYNDEGIDYFPQNEKAIDYHDILQFFLQYNISQVVETNYVLNPFIHGSVMFYQNILTTIGLYNERYTQAQDLDLWCRIMKKYNAAIIPERLYYWRNVPVSTTNAKKEITIKFGWEIFNKHLSELGARDAFISEKKNHQKVQESTRKARFF